MNPQDLKPIDLLDKMKVYQFIKMTESRNDISKLKLKSDLLILEKLLKAIEKWMNWRLYKLAESQKSDGKNKKDLLSTNLATKKGNGI